jgi:carboxymethylenebutenolidase
VAQYEGMLAESVNIQGHNGDQIEGYLARPTGAGPYPGVVVIHHMPGWDESTKEIARKFAHNGFAAIVPNLYTREALALGENHETAAARDSAATAAAREAGGVPDDRCIGDVEGAMNYLRTLPYCNQKVGVIGYCSGGRQVYLTACNIPSLDAAVDCYGGRVIASPEELTANQPVAPIDMTENLNCPLLGLFGADDGNPSPEHVAKMEEELKRFGKTYEFHTYEDAGHGFFWTDSMARVGRAMYRDHAATDGWQRIFAWYGKHLA